MNVRLASATMRNQWVYFVFAICVASAGCRLTDNVLRTTVVEPLQYSREVYERIARKRFIEMAQCALDQAISVERASLDNYECDPFSPDYQSGFIDGYVDYLEAGGTGEPPMLPPRRYWKASYQSAGGHQSAEEWFEGYRHGAETARASNHRLLVTVPLSDEIVSDTRPYHYGRIQALDEATAYDDDPGDHHDEGGTGDVHMEAGRDSDASTESDQIVDAEVDAEVEADASSEQASGSAQSPEASQPQRLERHESPEPRVSVKIYRLPQTP
ncbi:MAG: hypothetical protein KDB27_13110 [Planctomycetales bacterium]|nr:hypothetical protein [Planctomycetales bacterium]